MARQGQGTPWQHTAEGTATNEIPHHGSEHAPRPSRSNRNPITMTTAEASSVLTECTATRYSVPPPEPRPGRVPGHVPVAEPFDLRRVQQRSRSTPVCQQRRPVGLRRHGDRQPVRPQVDRPRRPSGSPGPRGARQRPLPSGHARAVRQADKEAQAKARARAAGDATENGHLLLAQPLSKTISIFAATPVPAAAGAGQRASKRAL